MMKVRRVYVFVLKKGTKFIHNGQRGICLDEAFPYRAVRFYTEMKPSKLWAYEKVRLV